jgi:GTP-binding protein
MEVRNIAIIAHVDHGKTALTDALMRQTGMFVEGMSMDTNALEQERGITIYSKNTALYYKGTKINIVDTPGHADFGSEVERILRSIDSVLLVVDAQEGPMPQTRFVLNKSLELGLKPIVVINKIDKRAADPGRSEEEVLELFLELGATEEQLEFATIYAVGREGIAKRALADESGDLTPLLDLILERVSPAGRDPQAPLQAQPFNLGYDDYLGRLAICRVYQGSVATGAPVWVRKPDGRVIAGKITKLFTFEGLSRKETSTVQSGDIVMIAGLPDIYIGDTVGDRAEVGALPSIDVDEPTLVLNFLVNTSPFAGRDGKYVTSRQLRERLMRELEVNVGLRVDFGASDVFRVYGRGELHIAILLENMRRESYEMQVSQPQVILKERDGVTIEPYEEMTIDVPAEYQGVVMARLGPRGATLTDVKTHEGRVRMILEGPTRGIIGYRNQFVVDTKGRGILASRGVGFRPFSRELPKRRPEGSMVAIVAGRATAFALDNLQNRGTLYIGPGTDVYEGMVVGNTAKGDELFVNPVKGKHLTNMRASGSDKTIQLEPPKLLSIEMGLEIMQEDEYLEITPKSVRLRKQQIVR